MHDTSVSECAHSDTNMCECAHVYPPITPTYILLEKLMVLKYFAGPIVFCNGVCKWWRSYVSHSARGEIQGACCCVSVQLIFICTKCVCQVLSVWYRNYVMWSSKLYERDVDCNYLILGWNVASAPSFLLWSGCRRTSSAQGLGRKSLEQSLVAVARYLVQYFLSHLTTVLLRHCCVVMTVYNILSYLCLQVLCSRDCHRPLLLAWSRYYLQVSTDFHAAQF